jgi:tetratricopeptide (TPR) repeat protein/transcriptional regulator with XRE-family HTH domain
MKKAHQGAPNQRLKAERELRGWSQKYVAEQLGADHYYLSRWERGTASPSPYYRQKLCVLFGKNAKELGLLQEEEESGRHDEEASERIMLSPPPAESVSDPAVPPLSVGTTGLVGRDEVFSQLKERLRGGRNMGLTAINGLPGVGKTTLAVALAHDDDVVGHFHDGILWAGLGLHPNVPGLLSRWGTRLGIPAVAAARLTSIEAWSQSIRAAIGQRRMLLVIDDAWQIEEALAFKVGGPKCAYLLTTRFPQIALQFTGEGTIALAELGEDDGFTLLARLAPETIAGDPEVAHALVRSAGGLPLALHLMGKYLRTQAVGGQPRRVRTAMERLLAAEQRLRLSEPQALLERSPTLPTGTPLSLQAIINVSDQQVDELARAALRRLAVFPAKPNTFSEEAAVAVCQVPAETLDTLSDAGLLEGGGAGRYTLHQTIADYARVHLAETAAYERLSAYFADYVQAHSKEYEALEQESSNIFAALLAASERGHQADLVRCTNAFAPFLQARGLYSQAEGYLIQAEQAARALHNSTGLVAALLHLGRICANRGDYSQAEAFLQEGLNLARQGEEYEWVCQILDRLGAGARVLGDYERAVTYHQEGLALARQIGDFALASILLQGLGIDASEQGHYEQAEEYQQEGVALARRTGDRQRLCELLANCGQVAYLRGDNIQGESYSKEALEIARQIGYRYAVSMLVGNLGAVATEQGNYAQAEAYLQESLDLARQIENRDEIASCLLNLSDLSIEQENYARAEGYLHEAAVVAHQIGRRLLLCAVPSTRGELHLKQHQWGQAEAAFREAMSIASEGNPAYQAMACYGLARVAAGQGDHQEAQRLGRESLRLFETIGDRMVSKVSAWLEALPAERQ